ncbi:reverse transcriptase domain-containing protein [Tanacetum coccineum]|uniref:Reverse transcriptase domain-containing protein n=1 Tax=Tanacetum coccineum TaxID=301880 RepID=A0ABQ4ZCE1_9ASTR
MGWLLGCGGWFGAGWVGWFWRRNVVNGVLGRLFGVCVLGGWGLDWSEVGSVVCWFLGVGWVELEHGMDISSFGVRRLCSGSSVGSRSFGEGYKGRVESVVLIREDSLFSFGLGVVGVRKRIDLMVDWWVGCCGCGNLDYVFWASVKSGFWGVLVCVACMVVSLVHSLGCSVGGEFGRKVFGLFWGAVVVCSWELWIAYLPLDQASDSVLLLFGWGEVVWLGMLSRCWEFTCCVIVWYGADGLCGAGMGVGGRWGGSGGVCGGVGKDILSSRRKGETAQGDINLDPDRGGHGGSGYDTSLVNSYWLTQVLGTAGLHYLSNPVFRDPMEVDGSGLEMGVVVEVWWGVMRVVGPGMECGGLGGNGSYGLGVGRVFIWGVLSSVGGGFGGGVFFWRVVAGWTFGGCCGGCDGVVFAVMDRIGDVRDRVVLVGVVGRGSVFSGVFWVGVYHVWARLSVKGKTAAQLGDGGLCGGRSGNVEEKFEKFPVWSVRGRGEKVEEKFLDFIQSAMACKRAGSGGRLCMHTRSSSNLVGNSSSNPTTTNPKRRNRRRSKQPFSLEESLVVTMADQRTIAELLRAPTEGYAEAIVVPPILAEHFELKHSLINMMTSDQFFGLEKDNPHDHIPRRWLEKEPPHSIITWEDLVSKFINEFFPPSRTTNLQNEIPNFQQKFDESFHEAWDRYKDLLLACPHHGFTELH